jgi:transposase
MDAAQLSDLDGLDREALKALLIAHQEELRTLAALAASHQDELRSLEAELDSHRQTLSPQDDQLRSLRRGALDEGARLPARPVLCSVDVES